MFSPKVSSINRRSKSTVSSRRSGSLNNSFTPKGRQPTAKGLRNLGLSHSVKSSILEETPQYTIENFGSTLPVLVVDALVYADKSSPVSIRINPNGWAWLVTGRKLILWTYKQSPHTYYDQCFELQLPPSGLAHSAERVALLQDHTLNFSSCLAVSPEGVVRYWPNITHESTTIEISANLGGEECATIIDFPPHGCLLATTTSTVLLLVPSQNSVICRSLKAGQGMFSGISRRMSSFFFGGNLEKQTDAPLQRIIRDEATATDQQNFCMLSGPCVQKWAVTEDKDWIISQANIERLFKDSCAQKIWNEDANKLSELKTWIIDMQLTHHGIMVLGAVVNEQVSLAFYYAFCFITMDSVDASQNIQPVVLLDYHEQYSEDREAYLTSYRLLVPQINVDVAFLYNSSHVLIIPAEPSPEPAQVVKAEFRSPGDSILGAGFCSGSTVFFSAVHGLISITTSLQEQKASMSIRVMDQSVSHDTSFFELTGLNVSIEQAHKLSLSVDRAERFKAAFLFYFSADEAQAMQIVEELFPDLWSASIPHHDLDKFVTGLSLEIINEQPMNDPRWAETPSEGLVSSGSLVILQQLKHKYKAHTFMIDFLKNIGAWDNLTYSSTVDGVYPTQSCVYEHAEKLIAACVLRELHIQYSDIIDHSISRVLQNRIIQSTDTLTVHDLFYRQVSLIYEIFGAILKYEEDIIFSKDLQSSDVIIFISSVNAIFESVFFESIKYRSSQYVDDSPQSGDTNQTFIPWTASENAAGGRYVLRKQFSLTLEQALPNAKNVETRGDLFQQLLSLADIILCGFSDQIDRNRRNSDKHSELTVVYEQERHKLISVFVQEKQYERAMSLAEKYLDFSTLIQICDITNNDQRLQQYKDQFGAQGFSQVLCNWYIHEGKREKLMLQSAEVLDGFLEDDCNKNLRWLHEIKTKQYIQAHRTQLDLALMEKQILRKRKTLLSLSKLSALASDDNLIDDNILRVINKELEIVAYQEALSPQLLENVGLDRLTMHVLSVEELVELMTGEHNVDISAYDFKKALDLLSLVADDMETNNLQITTWVKAVLHDRWILSPTDEAFDVFQQSMVSQIIKLAISEGISLAAFLPDLNAILAHPNLVHLKNNKSLEFILRAGFEESQKPQLE